MVNAYSFAGHYWEEVGKKLEADQAVERTSEVGQAGGELYPPICLEEQRCFVLPTEIAD